MFSGRWSTLMTSQVRVNPSVGLKKKTLRNATVVVQLQLLMHLQPSVMKKRTVMMMMMMMMMLMMMITFLLAATQTHRLLPCQPEEVNHDFTPAPTAPQTLHTRVCYWAELERERERENVCAFLDLLFSLPFEFMIKSLLREKEVKGKERKRKGMESWIGRYKERKRKRSNSSLRKGKERRPRGNEVKWKRRQRVKGQVVMCGGSVLSVGCRSQTDSGPLNQNQLCHYRDSQSPPQSTELHHVYTPVRTMREGGEPRHTWLRSPAPADALKWNRSSSFYNKWLMVDIK